MEHFIPHPHSNRDSSIAAICMLLCALAAGCAIDIDLVLHFQAALAFLTLAIVLGALAIALPPPRGTERAAYGAMAIALVLGLIIEAILLANDVNRDPRLTLGIALIAAIGAAQFLISARLRIPLFLGCLFVYCLIGVRTIHQSRALVMDVQMFQRNAAQALLHGQNPYSIRYPNLYPPNPPFYGPGIVDEHNNLTVGFPYPPLSLLLSLPAYAVSGDVHYADLAAILLSALLLATARPGPFGAAIAAMLLLIPTSLTILAITWTEPLLVLSFSLLMFCACRRPKALPYALGLFISTKQYAVLVIPLLPLLTDGQPCRKELMRIVLVAGCVAAVVNLPFFLWDPHSFIRSVVVFQFLQPFRPDALSYLAWIYRATDGRTLPIWISLLVIIPAYALALVRGMRCPAGFAATLALVCLVFFAFSKQAFCNYYYFAIAAALWSVAAAFPADAHRI